MAAVQCPPAAMVSQNNANMMLPLSMTTNEPSRMRIELFTNPAISGFAPNPSVVLADGIFYLVTSSFHIFPGLPIYASRNLQNWTHIGNAINRKTQLSHFKSSTGAPRLGNDHDSLAPDGLLSATIRFYNGTFYIVCTYMSNGVARNFIINTTDIWADRWSDPVFFFFEGIHPSLFFDGDGKAYIQGSWQIDRMKQPRYTIKQFEVNLTTGDALSKIREIWCGHMKYDTMGPHIYKRWGYYYLMVTEGGIFEHHILSIARSKSVWGPYESYKRNPVMTAHGKTKELVHNIGHGELFEDNNGLWWAMLLGARYDDGRLSLGRESFLTPVDWLKNDWPRIQQPRLEFERCIKLEKSRDLPLPRTDSSDVSDVFIRDPYWENYRFTGQGEERIVSIRPGDKPLSSSSDSPSFVGFRQRSIEDMVTASMSLSHCVVNKSLKAGLALYIDHSRHVTISRDFGSRTIEFNITNSAKGLLRCQSYPIAPGVSTIKLRITASYHEYRFFYKDDLSGEGWLPAGEVDVMDLSARDFTGPIFGVFAHSTFGVGEVEVTFGSISLDKSWRMC